MAIIIDGHNLIPKIKGLSLSDPDDERKLIELLQEYCRFHRKKVEVFFDGAPPGQARSQTFGLVTARFVRQGKTADEAIRERLVRLKRAGPNWTVVSSDLQVQAAARRARAQVVSAEQFAGSLMQTLAGNAETPDDQREVQLDDEEIEQWLQIFGNRKNRGAE